jgi:hypothetical protein
MRLRVEQIQQAETIFLQQAQTDGEDPTMIAAHIIDEGLRRRFHE